MPAKVVDLCDEIVGFLNSQTLSQSFTAIRRNVWFTDLAATNSLQVAVVPQDTETQTETRSASSRRFRVNVICQKRITGTELTEQDAMLLLMEEIEDVLYLQKMGNFSFVQYSETAGSRVFMELETMAEERLFRTVLQVTYLGV